MNFKKILNAIDKNDYSKVRCSNNNRNILLYDHQCKKYMKIDNEPFGIPQVQYAASYGMSIVHFDRNTIPTRMMVGIHKNNIFSIKMNDDIEAALFQISTLHDLSEEHQKNIIKTYKIYELIKNTESIDKIRICIYDYNAFFIENED